MKDVRRTTEAPDDRLGEIAGLLTETFDLLSPETDEVKMILMLTATPAHMVVLSNYGDDFEAANDMIRHLAAVFEANGRRLMVVPIGHD